MSDDFQLSIKDQEVGLVLDFLSGVDCIESMGKWYPGYQQTDNKVRYRWKQIMARKNVTAYQQHITDDGDLTSQINKTSIKKYLWEVATENKGTSVGLKAAQTLGKEFGIGSEHIVIHEEREFDDILRQINDYNTLLIAGENPELPKCLTETIEAEEAQFEIIEEEDVLDD